MNKLLVVLIMATLSSCANFAGMSVGSIGCPEEEIKIVDKKQGFNSASWVAECRGERFICQSMGDTNGHYRPAQCSKEVPKK